MKSGFLDKLIERLGRIGPEDVQNYLLQLAQEKGLIETVFNAIQEGIIVTDAKGRITYVNDAACELFGLEAESSIGKRLDERVRGLDWKSLSQSEGAISRDMEIFYPANRFLNFYIVPLLIERRTPKDGANSRAEPVGHAIILRDITESRRSTEKTIESERFNALTLLAAGVAHEIGNPLNSLHIHLQLMERKVRKLDGKVKEELQEAIAISRAEITPARFDRHAIPAGDPALEAGAASGKCERDRGRGRALFRAGNRGSRHRGRAGIAFRSSPARARSRPDEAGLLQRDQEQLRSDEAPRHSAHPDRHGRHARQHQLHRHRRRHVRGKLEPRLRALLYDEGSGSGLGLLIVRRIVREHGGEMAIESNEGKGLTLTIRLPYLDKRVRMLEAGTSKAEGGGRKAEVD